MIGLADEPQHQRRSLAAWSSGRRRAPPRARCAGQRSHRCARRRRVGGLGSARHRIGARARRPAQRGVGRAARAARGGAQRRRLPATRRHRRPRRAVPVVARRLSTGRARRGGGAAPRGAGTRSLGRRGGLAAASGSGPASATHSVPACCYAMRRGRTSCSRAVSAACGAPTNRRAPGNGAGIGCRWSSRGRCSPTRASRRDAAGVAGRQGLRGRRCRAERRGGDDPLGRRRSDPDHDPARMCRGGRAPTPGDHPGPTVFVGDADAWAANWALAARIREEAVIVVHGGAYEYRALIRDRALPPLLDEGSGQCWARFRRGSRAAIRLAPDRGDNRIRRRNRDRALNPNRMFPKINDSDIHVNECACSVSVSSHPERACNEWSRP